MDEIRWIETLAMNAWPAEILDELDGWKLRWHRMSSRRVNSVWPNEWGGEIPLAVKLEKVEYFYTLRGQPARFQICPAALPSGLDEVLEARGYTVDALTAVQTASVKKVLKQAYKGGLGVEVKVFERLEEEWVAAYCLVQEAGVKNVPARKEALGRVSVPGVYVLVRVNDDVAAVGRGVLERGWLGVFGMTTGNEFRRRGLATLVLGALAGWGQAHGAAKMYLQVMENNAGAKALYAKVGFETLYQYHYREQAHTL